MLRASSVKSIAHHTSTLPFALKKLVQGGIKFSTESSSPQLSTAAEFATNLWVPEVLLQQNFVVLIPLTYSFTVQLEHVRSEVQVSAIFPVPAQYFDLPFCRVGMHCGQRLPLPGKWRRWLVMLVMRSRSSSDLDWIGFNISFEHCDIQKPKKKKLLEWQEVGGGACSVVYKNAEFPKNAWGALAWELDWYFVVIQKQQYWRAQ